MEILKNLNGDFPNHSFKIIEKEHNKYIIIDDNLTNICFNDININDLPESLKKQSEEFYIIL